MRQLINNWQRTYQEIEAKPLSNRLQNLILAVVIGIVLLSRLLTIATPSINWTAWKEIDYLYISQNYWKQGFDFLRPEVGWPAEPPRVTEMEIPLVPFAAALFYQLFGFNAYTARAVTFLAFLLMMIYTFKLAKREVGTSTGIVAAFVAGVLPLYHPFGKLLFTEPSMIAMSVITLYYFAEWVEHERRKDGVLAFLALTLTIALKLESLYLFLPVAWIAFRKYGWEIRRYKNLVVIIVLALILPIIWYRYAYYLENTGAHLFGIFKGHNKSQSLAMLSNFQWYRTMAGRVINGILGGFYGTALFMLGLVVAAHLRKAGLFFAYLAAVLIYFVLIAEGNIDAAYRQLPIIPSISVFVAFGVQAVVALMISLFAALQRSVAYLESRHALVGVFLALVLVIPALDYRNIFLQDAPVHWERWQLATEIRKYTDQNSKLILVGEYSKHVGGYDLSPVLYYYSDLQGWTVKPDQWNMASVESLRAKGATHLAVILPYGYPYDFVYLPEESYEGFVGELRAKFPVLYEFQDQLLFDLR
jgi:hypothetical protein